MVYLTVDAIAAQMKQEMNSTQQEMAKRIGVSQPTVARALRGDQRQIKTLRKIARELGYDISESAYYKLSQPSYDS